MSSIGTTRRSWRAGAARVVGGVLVTAIAFGPAACGGDDADPDDAAASDTSETGESDGSTTEPADDTTTTTLSPEDVVVRDYEAASAAFSAAADPPNPDAPELAAHFTGTSLARYQDTLRSLQAAGARAENTVEHHPIRVTISGETAHVEDCFVDTTQQFNAATGQALGAPSTTTMHVDVELRLMDGVWKVAERTERGDQCTPS